jgi:hypothetical protein
MRPRDQRIAGYIGANRDRYTREAITDQLVAAGDDRAIVDAIWDALPNASLPSPPGRTRYVYVMLLIGGLLTALVSLILMASVLAGPTTSAGPWVALVFLVAPLLYVLIGRTVARRVAASDALRRGSWAFLGCAIPAIFLGISFGSCLAGTFLVPVFLVR